MSHEDKEKSADPLTEFMASMTNQMTTINNKLGSMEDTITSSISKAVLPLSQKLDSACLRIDRLEKRQEDISAGIDLQVQDSIRTQMEKYNSPATSPTMDGETYASATALGSKTPAGPPTASRGAEPDTAWYWSARRCLRFFPITGQSKEELDAGLEDFVLNKLKIPTGVLAREDINYVRKVKATKKSQIADEVLVSFTTVEARDLVHSYARNLGAGVGEDRRPLAGMRMEVPERLIGDFKTFEQYGHAMREKHGKDFRRHTKLDDTKLCLYMDAFVPKMKAWVRIDVDKAREDNERRRYKASKVAEGNKGLFSTVSEDDEEEEK